MLLASGFDWDSERNVVLIHDSAWTDCVKVNAYMHVSHPYIVDIYLLIQQNPRVVDYRYRPFPYYDNLVELFEGTYATGEYELASNEPSPADFIGPLHTGATEGELSPRAVETVQMEAITTVPIDPLPSSAMEAQGENAAPRMQPKKPNKRRRESGGVQISDLMDGIADKCACALPCPEHLRLSEGLQDFCKKEYADQLPTSNLVEAYNVMLNEAKAKNFVVMEAGVVRDAWLHNQLRASK